MDHYVYHQDGHGYTATSFHGNPIQPARGFARQTDRATRRTRRVGITLTAEEREEEITTEYTEDTDKKKEKREEEITTEYTEDTD